MSMLSYRTNVLLSSQEYVWYSQLAKQKNWSLSQMIRHALAQVYQVSDNANFVASLRQTWKLLKKPQQKMNYQRLVKDGRKY